jgi:uncharacterized OB-fold protein
MIGLTMTPTGQDSDPVVLFPSRGSWIEEGGKVFLLGSRCPNCGKHAFPQTTFCDQCGNSSGLETARLSGVGRLYSFTEVHVAPASLETPYVIGYVDFPEDVRVLGQLDHTADELRVGEPVEVALGVIRTSQDGRRVISYRFRKATGRGNA